MSGARDVFEQKLEQSAVSKQENNKNEDDYVPSRYCPILSIPFQVPVVLVNGKTVEEKAALQWLHDYDKSTCPISREALRPLGAKDYVKNYAVLNIGRIPGQN